MAGLNTAVSPLGSPDTARSTLSLNPFWPVTLIVLLALAPGRRVRLLTEDERLKFAGAVIAGAAMVSAMAVVPVRVPEVPVTVTV